MHILKKFFSKKYLNWIYSVLLLAMCAYMVMFSSTGYMLLKRSMLENDLKTSSKLLNQLKYNVNNMNEMLVNLCYSLYFNQEYKQLMYNTMSDEVNTDIKIGTINNSYINVYPFIDSIYIYNYKTKKLYSTNNKANYDESIRKLMNTGNKIPLLKPIFRTLPSNPVNPKMEKEVFTYFMYEYEDSDKEPMGAVIINENANWLIDNIRMLSEDDTDSQEFIFIMDDRGQLFGGNKLQTTVLPLGEAVREHLDKDKMHITVPKGSFDINIMGKDYLVNYLLVEKADWTLLKIQPYESIYKSVNTLRKILSILTLVFILAALFVARKLSHSIYGPIKNLMGQVGAADSNSMVKSDRIDEIKYLSEAYDKSVEQLETYRLKVNSDRQIVKNSFLVRLATDSISIARPDYEKAIHDFGLTLQEPFAVCILHIDDLYQFEKQYHGKDREMYKFAIMNIAGELIGNSYPNEMFGFAYDTIISIVSASGGEDIFRQTLEKAFQEAQNIVMLHFHLSFSVSISDITDEYSQIAGRYNEALINSKYRLCFGKKCIITPDKVKENNENPETCYSAALKKRFRQEVKNGDIKAAEDCLLKIVQEISKLNYNNIILAMVNVINDIKSAVSDFNSAKSQPLNLDFKSLEDEVFEFETLDEFNIHIENILQVIADKAIGSHNEKYLMIIEAVKDVIKNNYHNNRLCLQFIADKLFLDPKYVSTVFRKVSQLSILEYINDFRLERAIELLNLSQITVNEILNNVGFDNESYFYKQFKKKFGLTPREYTIKLARERVREVRDEDINNLLHYYPVNQAEELLKNTDLLQAQLQRR